MSDRNTIAQELTVEQLDQFIRELTNLPGKGRTLKAIAEKAATLGMTISLMSAKAFRDTTFARHLDRLRTAQEVALQVENVEQGGNTLANASAKLLGKRIFDQLLKAEEDESSEIDIDALSLSVSRLRQGDVASRGLEMKLKDYERKEQERAERKAALQKTITAASEKKGGLTKDTLEQIEAELAML